MGETLFIADLHLSPECPATVELFLRFLAALPGNTQNLYILGDLFATWVGDDDDTAPYPLIIAALRAVSARGIMVAVQQGNRDFLLGRRFAQAAGCKLLPDPYKIDLYGIPTLLMHGDLLCTDDVAYQRFRRFARNPLLQQFFLLRSLTARRRTATAYRQRSNAATATKSSAIMDVNQDTVVAYMRRFGVRQLIHGHTHRPAKHEFTLNGMALNRWVLPEWHPQQAGYLRCGPLGMAEVIDIPYATLLRKS